MHAAAAGLAPPGPPAGHNFHAAGHAGHAGTCYAQDELTSARWRVAPSANDTHAIAALKRNDEAGFMALLQGERAGEHGAFDPRTGDHGAVQLGMAARGSFLCVRDRNDGIAHARAQ